MEFLDEPPLLTPQSLVAGRFAVLRQVNQGMTSFLYQAMDLHSDQLVALRILEPRLAKIDQAWVQRVMRNAPLARQLQRDHHEAFIDAGTTADNLSCIATKVLSGLSLAEKISQQTQSGAPQLALFDAIGLLDQISEALAAMHSQNIVHRRLRPAKVRLLDGPKDTVATVKLVDLTAELRRTLTHPDARTQSPLAA